MSGDHSQPMSQLGAQLADIHAAAEPALWPPSPGWWALGIMLLIVIAGLLKAAARKHTVRKRRRAWLDALAQLRSEHDPGADPQAYVAAVNRLFRGVALRAFPDTGCARLEGEAWVAFITGLMPETADTETLTALARGPYEPAPAVDAASLEGLAASWVNRYG